MSARRPRSHESPAPANQARVDRAGAALAPAWAGRVALRRKRAQSILGAAPRCWAAAGACPGPAREPAAALGAKKPLGPQLGRSRRSTSLDNKGGPIEITKLAARPKTPNCSRSHCRAAGAKKDRGHHTWREHISFLGRWVGRCLLRGPAQAPAPGAQVSETGAKRLQQAPGSVSAWARRQATCASAKCKHLSLAC